MAVISSLVLEPYEYLKNLPGKSIRSKLIDSFNEWIGAEESKVVIIKNVIEKLHNASLMYKYTTVVYKLNIYVIKT